MGKNNYQTASVYEYLGLKPSANNVEQLRYNVEKYLKTKDSKQVNAKILELLLE